MTLIPYIVWKKKVKGEIDTALSLEAVFKITDRMKMWAEPIGGRSSPWVVVPKKETLTKIRNVIAKSVYIAHSGVDCGRNSIYWIRIKDKSANTIIIENFHEAGRKKVKREITEIEPELVYPLVRGEQIKKWCIKLQPPEKVYVLIPHNASGEVIPEFKLKTKYPKAFAYFSKFKKELESRSSYKLMGKKQPFYAVFKIGNYTFSPYKVVWREQAKEPIAAVIGELKDKYLGKKVIIPDHKLMLVECWDESEAYYLCAILNSSLVKLIAKAYMVETQISTHLLKYIRVLKYNPKDNAHIRLAALAKKTHILAQDNKKELIEIEEEIDGLVSQLYGLTGEELGEIKKSLAILEGGEIEEEEVEEAVELPPSTPDISLRDNITEAGKPFDVIVVVSNPLDEPLNNVFVKLELFDGRSIKKNFKEIKDEISFPLSFEGLKAGEYEVKATFEYVVGNIPKRIKRELTIYVKGFEVKHVERSFKPEDLLGV